MHSHVGWLHNMNYLGLRKIVYANDLVVVAEHREELHGALEEWNDVYET